MHYLYRQLCDDHRNMQSLLDALEQLTKDLARREREPETLSLILDAIDYINTYPDRWHHPIEDLAMQRLLLHTEADRDIIEAIQGEHQAITSATRHMNALFYAIANDAAVERGQLFSATQEYLQLQRDHMQRENESIFPQLFALLSADDWAAVEAQLQRQQDPLFGPDLKRLYESLHDYVVGLHEPLRASA
ncbi:hypothetical protein Maes01_01427 [Microbulbifer aestuariivivens]|uniref:Hemerythrin-like domain-containing protein n=1 Tax=Microbulbifer aestuariivivens TaxID=1908308 RepID=A0ABP9WNU7_9GAMM